METKETLAETTVESRAATTPLFRYVSVGLAFVVWGGWAVFINRNSEATSPLISGLVHGLFSSTVTIVMMSSVTWLYRRLAAPGPRMVLPAATTSIATGSCITAAHVMIGTANVAATVIPGLVVAFCFNLVTTYQLYQNDPTRCWQGHQPVCNSRHLGPSSWRRRRVAHARDSARSHHAAKGGAPRRNR